MNSVVHEACGCTNQEVYLPWPFWLKGGSFVANRMLREQPGVKRLQLRLGIGSGLRVLLLEH